LLIEREAVALLPREATLWIRVDELDRSDLLVETVGGAER